MNAGIGVLVAVLLLLVNAFFVGAEFALISTRRSAIEPLAKAGSRRARTTLAAMEQVSLLLAGAQLGVTLASLGLGAVAEPAVAHLLEGLVDLVGAPDAVLHPLAFAIALALVVFLHVVIGETVPKNLSLARPERAALVLVPSLMALVRVSRPAISGLNALANLTLRAFRVTVRNEVTSAFTRDEVAGLIAESHREGLLGESQHGLLAGALLFESHSVRDVLIPSAALVTVPATISPSEVERLAVRTGYSRFPVTDRAGELLGYLHLKDVVDADTDAGRREAPLRSKWIRPLPHVNADSGLVAVLADMRRQGAHLARVTDADGSLLGIVALGDVLTELVREQDYTPAGTGSSPNRPGTAGSG
jgi:CBS domain containing-hemolysin-like protein